MGVATSPHGITTVQLPTEILATITADSAVNFVAGTAPAHRVASDRTVVWSGSGAPTITRINNTNVEVAVVCGDISDFTTAFSYDDSDFSKWTLMEHAYRSMVIGSVANNVYWNVFDPSIHKVSVNAGALTFSGDTLTINDPDVTYTSVWITNADGTVLYTLGTDYVQGYDSPTNPTAFIITRLTSGAISSNATVVVNYDRGMPSMVTSDDIIGTYDVDTAEYTGLFGIETVYPDHQIICSVISVPFWDTNDEVAAVMEARTTVNGCFQATATCNLDTANYRTKDVALEGKTASNISFQEQIACWPCAGLSDKIIGMSTHCAVQLAEVDISHQFTPVASPSNNILPMDRLCLRDGTTIRQPKTSADLLSGQAIYTGLNWASAWRSWGNYTAIYPNSTDPAKIWIPSNRMKQYINNTLQIMCFQFLDQPMTQRWGEQVAGTAQQWLSYMVKIGALLGATILFRAQDNLIGQLNAGHAVFYIAYANPIPAQWIEFDVQFDSSLQSTLFTS